MTITQSSTRLVAVAAGVAVALVLMLGASMPARAAALNQGQVQAILNMLTAFGADQATINNVSAALNGQPTTGTGGTGTGAVTGGVCPFTWSRSLQQGSTGADVKALQQFLNMNAATMVAASGAGSPGKETMTFGPATKAAVVKFQSANGISAIGIVGPMTRAKLNSLCTTSTSTSTPTPTPGPTTGGTGLSVMVATQPANAVIPYSVSRAPFTRFTVTASSDGDVTLNNVTVERQGISKDTDIANVELLDSNGNIVGLTRTLNSNHQAVIGSSVVIPRGTSQTFTVAADTAAQATLNAGDIVSFAVVAVSSSGTTNGALPIVGASHTMNATLAIGSVTAAKGTNDPGAANTENVGTTNYIFSSIRLTAGSAEDVYVKSIRWHQIGSASQSNMANIVSVVNGQSYPTVASSDNYYLTTFPGQGILLTKGSSQDFAIQGDLVNGSSNQTVEFDIQKRTDIYAVGSTYGFGILPAFGSSAPATGTVGNSDDSYYTGYIATLSAGTVTVSTSNSVSASNIALNQQNQTLGGFSVAVLGESIQVGKMVFRFSGSTSATYTDLTSVSLVNQNGTVLAGPADATTNTTSNLGKVTFTDTVTIPVGTTQLYLKGKLSTNFSTNDTIQASTTPSTDWTSITGNTTGKTLTAAPASALTSASMTVKNVSLTASVSSAPIAQTIIAGTNQFEFSDLILDATASGEDVRVTTIPIEYTWTGAATDLTNCQLYNGATSVSDQHVVNPTSANTTGAAVSYTLNSGGVVIPKGTSLTLAVKCDVRSGATGSYKWGLLAAAAIGGSGVTSGNALTSGTTLTVNASAGQSMAATSGGSMTVAVDSGSPTYGVASAGSTGVDLGHLRFSATTEALNLKQVALQLTKGSRIDLVNNQVTLWDATTNTQVGTATFPTGAYATSSQIATGAFTIPAQGSRVLIIKGDLAGIGVNGPATASGDEIQVSYDGNNIATTQGTYATGVSSGSNVDPTTATDQTTNGVTVYKSFPTFTYSTTGATLTGGVNDLLTLTVTADAKGDVRLQQLTFAVATSTITDISSPTFSGPTGQVNNSALSVTGVTGSQIITVPFDSSSNTADRIIAAGTSKTFTLRATVDGLGTNGGSVSVSLKADSAQLAYPAAGSGLASTTGVGGVNSGINIWSPLSTSTTNGATTDVDWTNSYGLAGCFSTVGLANNCTARVLSK